MVLDVWDYVNSIFRRLRGDTSGRAVTLPEGQYLLVPPTLADEEYHHLTLTSDAKLRVDDPTTQAEITAVEAKLDNAIYGLAALRALLVIAQADLDNPNQYKADVSALALEATLTAIKGAGWSTETLKAIKDAIAAITTERGTDGAALASAWTAALATALGSYTAARAGYLDNINNAQLLNISATILGRIDAAISSRLAATTYKAPPTGALSTTTGTISGSGWIVGAYASHRPSSTPATTYRTVSLAINGGAARIILTLYGKATEAGISGGGVANGVAVGLLVRYTTGFTVSSATSGEASGTYGLLYVPD